MKSKECFDCLPKESGCLLTKNIRVIDDGVKQGLIDKKQAEQTKEFILKNAVSRQQPCPSFTKPLNSNK